MPGDVALGERAPRASRIEGQWGLCVGIPLDWEKWRPYSWKLHTDFHVHWVPGKSRGSIGIWVGPDCSAWRISWENREWLWLVVGKGHWKHSSWEYTSACVSLEVAILGKSGPTHQCWEAPGQKIIQVGSQPHPSAKRLPKDPPRHTDTSDLAKRQSPTHQRDKNQLHLPVGRHQSLPSGSLQQALVPTSGTRGADIRGKRLQLHCLQKGHHTKNLEKWKDREL